MPLKRARLKISDYNDSRKRKLRDSERKVRAASLSLTSMVDMFAILVIFLLTNNSSVTKWLEMHHAMELPQTKFSESPKKRSALIEVAREGVFADKNRLATISQVQSGGATITALKNWLSKQDKNDGYVSVMADKKVAFGVIKKIISTCEVSGFKNVNLAVQPKSEPAKREG
ncbi:MAG: ExbD/TolR family protein [Bacteriovoracia bacterium]